MGATVEVTAEGVVRRDVVTITAGFQTQVPFDLHFGLGDVTTIEALEVQWPSGDVERWRDLPVDRLLLVREGTAEVVAEALGRWPPGTRPNVIGAPTPTLEAQLLDGDVAPIAGDRRPAVINFWAPWCAPCNVELPQLVTLAERYGDEVDFVGMSVGLADLDTLLLSIRDERVFEADLELVARTSFSVCEYEKAIDYYRRLIDADPRRVQPLYQIGLASLRLGNVDDAREALEQVVARSPTHVLAQFNLGVARFRSGDVGAALRNFQAASGLAGSDPVVLRRLGTAAVEAGQFWLASDVFDRAVAARPTLAPAWIDKARVHCARGQIDRARQS